MVVSLQYYLEYCTTPISPNCHPLEVSKGGLFLHMPYVPLPHSICNGRGHGGVCLIGWLPYVRHLWVCHSLHSDIFQVEEELDHKGKPYWADFKCNLYHRSMEKISKSIIHPSQHGMVVDCANNNSHCIFPFIQDISANTEELWVHWQSSYLGPSRSWTWFADGWLCWQEVPTPPNHAQSIVFLRSI